MMNLYGGTGMGTTGTGVNAMGQMQQPGPGMMTPQIMAMLNSMGQQQPPQGGPFQAPPTGTPMANFIGQGAAAPMGHPPMAPPLGQPPGMDGQGAAPAGMGGSPQLMQLLAALKGSQTGVSPNAGGTIPPWMLAMMGGNGTGADPSAAMSGY